MLGTSRVQNNLELFCIATDATFRVNKLISSISIYRECIEGYIRPYYFVRQISNFFTLQGV